MPYQGICTNVILSERKNPCLAPESMLFLPLTLSPFYHNRHNTSESHSNFSGTSTNRCPRAFFLDLRDVDEATTQRNLPHPPGPSLREAPDIHTKRSVAKQSDCTHTARALHLHRDYGLRTDQSTIGTIRSNVKPLARVIPLEILPVAMS